MNSFFSFLSTIKIKHRLPISFVFLSLFTLFIAGYLFYSMDSLKKNTVYLYQHPLTVTNAVRDVNIQMLSMQLQLKEVIFSSNETQIESALQKITQNAANIQQLLDLIKQRFLGVRFISIK